MPQSFNRPIVATSVHFNKKKRKISKISIIENIKMMRMYE